MIAYLVLYRRMWHKMMAQSLGRTASSPRLTRAADRARRPMFRLMHEMRVRIMIAPVDPLAADADLAAASWAGIHRLKSSGGAGYGMVNSRSGRGSRSAGRAGGPRLLSARRQPQVRPVTGK